MKKYVDGWEGITVKKWKEMYEEPYYKWPVWCICEVPRGDGMGMKLDIDNVLGANGLNPKKIPTVMRDDKGTAGDLIKRIASVIDVEYVTTPEI